MIIFSGCMTTSEEFVMDSSGGEIVSGRLKLNFPEGAVANDAEVTVQEVSFFPDHDGVVRGTIFELGPDGMGFDKPVKLTIGYDPKDIPDGTEESMLKLARVNDDFW
jgi:hypothetical protein